MNFPIEIVHLFGYKSKRVSRLFTAAMRRLKNASCCIFLILPHFYRTLQQFPHLLRLPLLFFYRRSTISPLCLILQSIAHLLCQQPLFRDSLCRASSGYTPSLIQGHEMQKVRGLKNFFTKSLHLYDVLALQSKIYFQGLSVSQKSPFTYPRTRN